MQRHHPSPGREMNPSLQLDILVCSCYQHKCLSYAPFYPKFLKRHSIFCTLFHSQVDSLTDKGKTDSQQDICHLHKLFSFFRYSCPVRPSSNLMSLPRKSQKCAVHFVPLKFTTDEQAHHFSWAMLLPVFTLIICFSNLLGGKKIKVTVIAPQL